jgi:hypothetical protein
MIKLCHNNHYKLIKGEKNMIEEVAAKNETPTREYPGGPVLKAALTATACSLVAMAGIGGSLVGFSACYKYFCSNVCSQTPELQRADLNNNGKTSEFYVINGRIAVVSLDGKPVY